jgi:ArsR family transcriptional regulator
MNTNYKQIAEELKALAHPVRLQIVTGLLKNECNVSEIQQALKLPQSTISQHLRILKNAGIIKGRREGTKVCYKVLNKWVKEIIKVAEKE